MQFCPECNNMYYMRLGSASGSGVTSDKLEFYCRNCGHEDSTLTNENIICVSEYQTQSSDMKLKNMINKYTKYDPTLPRANNILCPNTQCTNHTRSVDLSQSSNTQSSTPITRTVSKVNKGSLLPIGGAIATTITSNTESMPIHEETVILKSRDSDIIYIRYDDENMKYAWICSKCDYTWTNDNHIDNKN